MSYPISYGSYTLLESIGQGGMSAIDLAQVAVSDAQYVRFLVIKRMQTHLTEGDPSFIRMFQDEARISAELQHANIAQVYNFGQIGDEFFMAMEYIPGVDVREMQKALAQQRKGIPIRITLKILYEVLAALDYAHNRVDTYGKPMNIVHRDVNPRNVMLSIRGEVKLIDFGVAKSETKLDKTIGHTIKGKFAYMAPEQIDPSVGDIDGRVDLFALGLMMHEMVEGARPFHGLNEIQIMHKILSVDIPALQGPTDHPRADIIRAIHKKVLSLQPKDRFASAQAMQQAIQEAAMACGGMASAQELAEFLRKVMPEQFENIAHRLERYRQEATGKITPALSTQLTGNFGTTSQSVLLSEFTPTNIGQHHMETINVESQLLQQQNDYVSPTPNKNNPHILLWVGGLVVFVSAFVVASWWQRNSVTPTENTPISTSMVPSNQNPQTTEKQSTHEPSTPSPKTEPIQENSSDKTVEKIKTSDTKTDKQSGGKNTNSSKNTQKDRTETVESPKTQNTTNTDSTQKTDVIQKQDTEIPPTNTVIEKQHTIQNTPKTETKTETKVETKVEPKIESTPAPVMHKLYLQVGVTSGTRDLPVFVDNKEMTKTGTNKMVEITEGTHTIKVVNTSGQTATETITITPKTPNTLRIEIRGL